MIRFGSVCSGIEAASVAWHPLGWRASFLSEIEAFPRAVLQHHYPEVPLHGDFTTIKAGEYRPIDLLVGGTPCQSFSVAGLRGGLDDDRGNLALEYLRLADRLRPRWLVWENVPGVLSSNGGRDFGAILGGMVELGYGFAYRVLDAQFFGVAQRRRRVFVVGYAGDWRRAAAVLFERHGLQGHPAPRREAGKAAPTIPSRSSGGGGLGTDFDGDGGLIAHAIQERAVCENPSAGPDGAGFRSDDAAYTLEARAVPQAVAFNITPSNSNKDYNARESDRAQALTAGGNRPSARGGDLIAFDTTQITSAANYSNPKAGDPCHPLASGAHAPAVAFALRGRDGGAMPDIEGNGDRAGALRAASGGSSRDYVAFMENQRGELRTSDQTDALTRGGGKPGQGYAAALAGSAVRRLTPRECERLQGFPDDYSLIPYRKGMAADGPRYKALGNSMAVPVMRWIGERIQAVEAITNPLPANDTLPGKDAA